MPRKKKRLIKRIPRIQRPVSLIIFSIVVVLALGFAGYVYAHTERKVERLVTFHDRGKDRVILTDATSVAEALRDAKITVTTGDVVEPALGSALFSTDSAVIIYRARPVLVVDGSLKQKVMTAAVAPNEIMTLAGIAPLQSVDTTSFREGNLIAEGASTVLTIERGAFTPIKTTYVPKPNALTKSRGAQIYVDANGISHRETYYDLPMNVVMQHCGGGDYTIRSDGAKIDKDGYVLVAASYRNYPKCTIVDTSMGLGKVYDTGGFALRYPHGFDLATDWSNFNGR